MSIHQNLLGGPDPTYLQENTDAQKLLAGGAAPAEVAARFPTFSLAWAQLAEEAAAHGLEAEELRHVPETDEHVGSEVVVFRG